jgi:hypothetical protein
MQRTVQVRALRLGKLDTSASGSFSRQDGVVEKARAAVKRALLSAAQRSAETAERVVVSRRAMMSRVEESAGRVEGWWCGNGRAGEQEDVVVVVEEARFWS